MLLTALSGLALTIASNCTGFYGVYNVTQDKITICKRINGEKVEKQKKIQALVHELGHRYWRKYLDNESKKWWQDNADLSIIFTKEGYKTMPATELFAEYFSYHYLKNNIEIKHFTIDLTLGKKYLNRFNEND